MTTNCISSPLLALLFLLLPLSQLTWMALSAPSFRDCLLTIQPTVLKPLPTSPSVTDLHSSPEQHSKGIERAAKVQHWRDDFDDSQRRRTLVTNTTTTTIEVNALLAFKRSILNDPTGALANWTMENNSTYCSTWKGVACDNLGHVTQIDLGNTTFNGTITPMIGDLIHLTFLNLSGSRLWGPWLTTMTPYNTTNSTGPTPFRSGLETLWGPIPFELMKCKNLSALDLSFNSLDGDLLPKLFTLPKLEFLRLSFNKFPHPISLPEIQENGCLSLTNLRMTKTGLVGSIPSTLSRCQNLEYLVLEENQLNGSIPASLGELRQLQEINFGENKLTGYIPYQLGSLKNLNVLDLFKNNLEGHIPPSFGMLNQLQMLYLKNNSLSGSIPSSLGNCSSLYGLDLSSNSLTGSIPLSLGLLNGLKFLDLNNNKLTGTIPLSLGNCSLLFEIYLNDNNLHGAIPKEFGNLTSLVVLDLHNNPNLTGPIPNLLSKNSNLEILALSGCGFTSIDSQIWNIKSLQAILFSQNNLHGTLPLEVGNCTSLTSLDLSFNKLTGTIPPTLILLKNLTTLNLQSNMFIGAIPSLDGFQNLEALKLGQNQFNGTLQFNFVMWSTLKYLSVPMNNLMGKIPPSFASINSSLIFMDFSQNNFTGGLPDQVDSTHLSNLRVLVVSQNQLEGPIPSWIGNLKSLQVLDLSFNRFSYSIPQNFNNLNGYKINDNVNASLPGGAFTLQENLNLAIRGQSYRVEYSYILLTTTYMDLSSNALHGEIPLGITELVALKYLILSKNKLKGGIWNEFEKLVDLETLDLSQNNLNGPIPSHLAYSLSTFNVSFNNLSGSIPIGGQFDTFNTSSYLPGNPGLCGEIIHEPCHDIQGDSTNNSFGDEHQISNYISLISFGIGTTTGFFIVVGISLCWYRARVFVFNASERDATPMVHAKGYYGLFTYPS